MGANRVGQFPAARRSMPPKALEQQGTERARLLDCSNPAVQALGHGLGEAVSGPAAVAARPH
jgi:hypothetical protein